MRKSLLFIGLLVLIIVVTLLAIPTPSKANPIINQEQPDKNSDKKEIKYCCPKCNFCETKNGKCPKHNCNLVKEGNCYCGTCNTTNEKAYTCPKCGKKMNHMECKKKEAKKEEIKK